MQSGACGLLQVVGCQAECSFPRRFAVRDVASILITYSMLKTVGYLSVNAVWLENTSRSSVRWTVLGICEVLTRHALGRSYERDKSRQSFLPSFCDNKHTMLASNGM